MLVLGVMGVILKTKNSSESYQTNGVNLIRVELEKRRNKFERERTNLMMGRVPLTDLASW
jgi:hypothetical protein